MNLRIYAGLSHACEAVVRQRRKIARHGRRPRGRKMKITKIRIPSSVRTRIWPFIWAVSHSRAAKFIVPELLCAISCHTHTYTLRHHKKKPLSSSWTMSEQARLPCHSLFAMPHIGSDQLRRETEKTNSIFVCLSPEELNSKRKSWIDGGVCCACNAHDARARVYVMWNAYWLLGHRILVYRSSNQNTFHYYSQLYDRMNV